MVFNTRKTVILIVLVGLVAGGLVWTRSYIFTNVAAGINERIDSLKLSGFIITYDSLSVNWRTNLIEINNLLVEKNPYDTVCVYPEFVKVRKVRLSGLHLIPLIFRNILRFDKVYLDEPHLVIRQHSLFKGDSVSKNKNEFSLRIREVSMKAVHVEYIDSAACEPIVGFKSNLALRGLKLDFNSDQPFVYQAAWVTFDSIQMRMIKKPYTYEILQAKVDFTKKTLTVDTVRFLPDFGKLEYGNKFGYQVDRFEGVIPFIKATGFTFSFRDSSMVRASTAELQFFMKVFRDKRLPFKREEKSLPTAELKNLAFNLFIDTLKVVKSFVQYEEFEMDAQEPGKIYFDDLGAVFTNIDNTSLKAQIKLEANASLMGEGKVILSGVFPMNPGKRSRVSGSLQNFSIPKLNSMLTPATNIKVESGRMDKFLFNFSYNERSSRGEIELNYNDLKLVTYKEEEKSNGDGPERDNLKTFMMNAFVFRKNMDEDVPEEKRTGTIKYLRDGSRSVFNFWLKSVLSGIKSAYNLDKIEAKKNKRDVKKEERTARREARKLKKAAKNKERG